MGGGAAQDGSGMWDDVKVRGRFDARAEARELNRKLFPGVAGHKVG
jgi:hypothetical protein